MTNLTFDFDFEFYFRLVALHWLVCYATLGWVKVGYYEGILGDFRLLGRLGPCWLIVTLGHCILLCKLDHCTLIGRLGRVSDGW